jgi:hypothetical protein
MLSSNSYTFFMYCISNIIHCNHISKLKFIFVLSFSWDIMLGVYLPSRMQSR